MEKVKTHFSITHPTKIKGIMKGRRDLSTNKWFKNSRASFKSKVFALLLIIFLVKNSIEAFSLIPLSQHQIELTISGFKTWKETHWDSQFRDQKERGETQKNPVSQKIQRNEIERKREGIRKVEVRVKESRNLGVLRQWELIAR